jgi:hypothetical protein
MDLTGAISQIYGINANLPLQYGGMYQNAYDPYFDYAQQQGNNLAGLGQQNISTAGQVGNAAMGLYGNLANTQASMYQSELPLQMQSQMFNSLAPVLGGLLQQGGFGGLPEISPVQMSFNRPDVMSGFPGVANQAYGAVNNAYDRGVETARAYDDSFNQRFDDMLSKMPAMPGGGGWQGTPEGRQRFQDRQRRSQQPGPSFQQKQAMANPRYR